MKSSIFRSALYASVFLAVGCASQQDLIRADSRITNLERRGSDADRNKDQFQDFRKSQMEKDQQLRSQYAELSATIDELRDQIQILRGKVDEKEHRQQGMLSSDSGDSAETKLANLDQAVTSLKDRLTRIEEYLAIDGGAKKAAPPAKPALPGPEKPAVKEKPEVPPVKELSENELYNKAKQEFDAGELDASRNGFSEFIKRFPKSPIADSAQFWIGEVYYRQKWYEKAILEYQKVIENYPKGNKVSAALLKQGFSFFNLGDKSNGRLVLKELIKKYPSSNEAKIAKQKLESS